MSSSHRAFSALRGVALISLAATALAPPAGAQPARFGVPEFSVAAVKFKSIRETHPHLPGSDEVYLVFSDLKTGDSLTKIYGDVDAGESRDIRPEERCIAPRPACDHGAPDVHFKLTMWENDDDGFAHGALDNEHTYLDKGVYEGDDLIGRAEVNVPKEDLLRDLPTVGAYKDYVVTPTGGAGHYELTYRVTRMRNGVDIPPIGPPVVLVTISLQATGELVSSGAGRVTLTWSGANTSTVDIYRDGAKIVTTANDGSHVDPVAIGTYRYRVCDLGSTTCSADVQVTVG